MEITLQKVHGSMNTFYMVEGAERSDYDQLALQLAAVDPGIDGLTAERDEMRGLHGGGRQGEKESRL